MNVPDVYTPSRNQGPGGMNHDEAEAVRRSLSGTQTASKKAKIYTETAVTIGKGLEGVANVVGGTALVEAGFANNRHQLAPKRTDLTVSQERACVDVVGGNNFLNGETMFLQLNPSYVGTQPPNQNCSGRSLSTAQYTLLSFKDTLPYDVNPTRGKRLADAGAVFIETIASEMHDQAVENWAANGSVGPMPAPLGLNHLKAAVQQSVLLGYNNRNRPRATRLPVNKDMTQREV